MKNNGQIIALAAAVIRENAGSIPTSTILLLTGSELGRLTEAIALLQATKSTDREANRLRAQDRRWLI